MRRSDKKKWRKDDIMFARMAYIRSILYILQELQLSDAYNHVSGEHIRKLAEKPYYKGRKYEYS